LSNRGIQLNEQITPPTVGSHYVVKDVLPSVSPYQQLLQYPTPPSLTSSTYSQASTCGGNADPSGGYGLLQAPMLMYPPLMNNLVLPVSHVVGGVSSELSVTTPQIRHGRRASSGVVHQQHPSSVVAEQPSLNVVTRNVPLQNQGKSSAQLLEKDHVVAPSWRKVLGLQEKGEPRIGAQYRKTASESINRQPDERPPRPTASPVANGQRSAKELVDSMDGLSISRQPTVKREPSKEERRRHAAALSTIMRYVRQRGRQDMSHFATQSMPVPQHVYP